MGQESFNTQWMRFEPGKDFDPPACEAGMLLLRRWANADPTLARQFPRDPPTTPSARRRRPTQVALRRVVVLAATLFMPSAHRKAYCRPLRLSSTDAQKPSVSFLKILCSSSL
jgi:hypothetical protein